MLTPPPPGFTIENPRNYIVLNCRHSPTSPWYPSREAVASLNVKASRARQESRCSRSLVRPRGLSGRNDNCKKWNGGGSAFSPVVGQYPLSRGRSTVIRRERARLLARFPGILMAAKEKRGDRRTTRSQRDNVNIRDSFSNCQLFRLIPIFAWPHYPGHYAWDSKKNLPTLALCNS